MGFENGSESLCWYKAPCTYAVVELFVVDFSLLHNLSQQITYGQVIESKFLCQPLAKRPFTRSWTA
jgi:hypothetical protein